MREEREEKGGASRNPKWRSIKIGGEIWSKGGMEIRMGGSKFHAEITSGTLGGLWNGSPGKT